MTDNLVKRLREGTFGSGIAKTDPCLNSLMQEAADEIERLRAALHPFTRLFLYPDDLGFEASLDIKEDSDWDDDANDMQTENCFVLRRDIRAARAALAGEKSND